MCQISASKYIGLFLLILTKNAWLETADEIEYSEVVLILLLPDIETSQKTTKACAGSMISFSHFLTLARCADQVRKKGPHGKVFSDRTGIEVQSKQVLHLDWKHHKFYDGEEVHRDLSIVQIEDPIGYSNSSVTITNYCPSCFNDCYTVGWGTFQKSHDNLGNMRQSKFGTTRMQVLREDLVNGSTSDITSKRPKGNGTLIVDLGSPLFCRQKVGEKLYTGLVGVLLEQVNDDIFKYRSLRGLMTWTSNRAMGALIAPDGKLDVALVCTHTDCDTHTSGKKALGNLKKQDANGTSTPSKFTFLQPMMFMYFSIKVVNF